jgi:gentisate 1,2-dioxygenase
MAQTARFLDVTGGRPAAMDLWPAIVIPKETIDADVERLANLPRPANGRRRALIVHPRATRGNGLAPGIQVALDVLLPGERTVPYRQNSTQVNFVIRGSGHSVVGAKRFEVRLFDVWNTPSMQPYWHGNDGEEVLVRLTYSNAALLEQMNTHYVEETPPLVEPVKEETLSEEDKKRRVSPYGTFQLTEEGAFLMPYESLINPPTVESNALHWPWQKVKEHLDKLEALSKDYVGRRLYMLYNPMTGRTNGCTPSFFATMTIRPPKIVDRPHRHTSAAINYYFHGSGRSTVEGQVLEWKAGDLMLSAPGWAVHNHASYDEYVYELTIQDQPLNIAMESLLWQESLKMPLAVLGVEQGFGTNRAAG